MLLGEFEQVLNITSVMRPHDFREVRYLNTLSVLEGVMEDGRGFHGRELPAVAGQQNVDAGKGSGRAGGAAFPRMLRTDCFLQAFFQHGQNFQG